MDEDGEGQMENGAAGGGERHRLMQPRSDTSLTGRSLYGSGSSGGCCVSSLVSSKGGFQWSAPYKGCHR